MVDLKAIMLIWQFLSMIAPMIGQIYDVCRQMFPDGTPGAIKMDAFKTLLQQVVASRDELKKFEPIWNDAWPLVKSMVDAFHVFKKQSESPAPTDPAKT